METDKGTQWALLMRKLSRMYSEWYTTKRHDEAFGRRYRRERERECALWESMNSEQRRCGLSIMGH